MQSLGEHINRLSLLNTFPKVFNGSINFFNGFLNFTHRYIIGTLITFLCNLFGDISKFLVGQHFKAFADNTIFNIILADYLLITFLFASFLAHIVVILLARLSRTAVSNHHFLTL